MDYCYSPRPLADYVAKGGTLLYCPATDLPAWNLIWLAMPSVDMILDPNLVFEEFAKLTDFKRMGRLSALARAEGVVEAMGRSPVAFVQDLQDLDSEFVQRELKMHGQSVIDTMTARAYQSAGLAEVFEAAKVESNVIVADFVARRRA